VRVLVLLTDGFGGHGGIAKFNRDLLRTLCALPECKEVVAIPRLMPEPPGPLPAGLRHVTAGLSGKLSYAFAVLDSCLRRGPFDLIVCAHVNLLPVASVARRLQPAPLLLVVHGIEAWQPTGRSFTDRAARRVDGLVAVSRFTRERFLAWTGLPVDRAHVLPNCIQTEAYGPGPRRRDLIDRYGLEGRRVLLTLGRLSAEERYKGVDEVLEVLPELAAKLPNLSYLIAGDGTDRDRLEKKSRELGVGDRVVFAGRIAEQEKADHYRLADAFVMPGFGEGFGIVYLEAMACGVPVVASKADASREAVRDGALGVVVDPRNREELKAGILSALSQPTGKVPVGLDYFSFDNFQARLREIVKKVLATS